MPFEGKVLRKETLAIIAGLITEGPFQGHVAGRIDQRLQGVLGGEGDLPADLQMVSIYRNCFVDRGQVQRFGCRILEIVELRGSPRFELPVDWNIALDSRRVEMHVGFEIDIQT